MIPTAEDFIDDNCISFYSSEHLGFAVKSYRVKELMIEFAKMHVEQALKEVLSKMYIETDLKGRIKGINEYSILNAYPIDNIK